MSDALVARLKVALSTLWAHFDVEKSCLPKGSCIWLLGDLKDMQDMPVRAGYASSSRVLTEAVEMVEGIPFLRIASLSLTQVTALTVLLTQAITLLASPLPPATVHDPSRPTLPSEIISIILQQLAVDEWAPKSAVPACCLVSKSFLPLAREALYHTLHLRISAQGRKRDDLPRRLCNALRRGCDLTINYEPLWTTLRHHPFLLSLVRRMEVKMLKVEEYSGYHQAFDDVLRLLEGSGARHVSLHGATASQASHFSRALWRSRQQFHSIELGDLSKLERVEEEHTTYSHFRELLGEQTELKELSLRAKEGEVGFPYDFKSSLVRIDLDIAQQKEGITPLFKSFTERSSCSLLHATLPFHPDPRHPKDAEILGDFRALRSLDLRLYAKDSYRQPSKRVQPPDVDARCKAFLSNIPHTATSLQIIGDSCTNHPIMHHLQSLPPSIKHLNLRALECTSAIILPFLRSRCLPRLQRLEYWDEEDLCEEDGGWSDEGREEVLELLEELGIEGEGRWN
ncbi:hypothetical protein BCR35DRAFT_305537, partial [Leucosporidium creatinivorum]